MSTANQHKIVILDKDQHRRDFLRSILAEKGHTPFLFEKTSRCLDNIAALNPDLVISGSLSPENTFRFINTLKSTKYSLPVMIISDDQNVVDFVSTNGFDDVSLVHKDLSPYDMQGAINKILDSSFSREGLQECPLIVGTSADMVKIKRLISELNRLNEPALIQGEAGSGKDLIARVIHSRSDRHDKPFVKVHVPELLKRAEGDDIFQLGSITVSGGDSNISGIFALAQSGTLFLDEIGSMTAELQAYLLQFLKECDVLNPGEKVFDIRVLAATRKNLKNLVERGDFRKDLYYRLNVINIEIPPLRNRVEDIPQLTDFFTDRVCHQLGKSYYRLAVKTKDTFRSYIWPGNVRELEQLVGRIVSLGDEEAQVEKLYLHTENERLLNHHNGFLSANELEKVKDYIKDTENLSLKEVGQKFLYRVEKKLVKNALDSTNWNRRKAAVMLDISYKSLLNKIKDYDLTEVH
jgi:DNA-binding NtrC family response regulator